MIIAHAVTAGAGNRYRLGNQDLEPADDARLGNCVTPFDLVLKTYDARAKSLTFQSGSSLVVR
jgi:hypothetical protein